MAAMQIYFFLMFFTLKTGAVYESGITQLLGGIGSLWCPPPRGTVGLSRRVPRVRPPRPLPPLSPQLKSVVHDGGGRCAGTGEALAAAGRSFPGGESLSLLLSLLLLLSLSLPLFLSRFPAGGGPAPLSPPRP